MSRARGDQAGNSMLLAMIVLSALGALGSLTVVSVQGVLKASTNDRSQAIAMYAAESGAAAAMDALRRAYVAVDAAHPAPPLPRWSAFVHKANQAPLLPLATTVLPSNGVLPGDLGHQNLFTTDLNAWFSVTILNNPDDAAFNAAQDNDADGQVIIQSTGHGPQGALAIIEWEVRRLPAPLDPPLAAGQPPPAGHIPYGLDPDNPAATPLILLGWRVVF